MFSQLKGILMLLLGVVKDAVNFTVMPLSSAALPVDRLIFMLVLEEEVVAGFVFSLKGLLQKTQSF